jgi:hypothetical protein
MIAESFDAAQISGHSMAYIFPTAGQKHAH